ncbi:alpha/beta hydrolase family protein [Streptomyces sp. enrichment culture]|uniref:alpha/beta hydrolase family protein n=1 Tax=Streptomyces sp. enrichment culture TaxID=1795815 RepID=UPI003F5456FF
MGTRRLRDAVVVCLAAVGVAALAAPTAEAGPRGGAPCPEGSPADVTCTVGQLTDGTPYRFVVPDRWNGVVIVDLDFVSRPAEEPLTAELTGRGYAVGGTTRDVTGWRIAEAIDNQASALRRFEETVGRPRWAVASGRSMGGFVSAGAAQVHPDVFDAAVPFCGGLGGAVGQWNQKLDTVFTLKNLLFPDSTLPVTGIPSDTGQATARWRSALASAQQTPAGRARIALAAAIGQLPGWGLDADGAATPMPDPGDADAVQEGMYLALAGGAQPYVGQAMSSRRSIETLAGGNPSWNTGVDYARQFASASPEQRRTVREMYSRAGLDVRADVGVLSRAPRIRADPAAVAYLEKGIVFDGDLEIPVLTVNPIGDQISTVAQQQSYGKAARAAGKAALLRQSYVRSVGHCGFTPGEQVAAITAMTQRLTTGHWSDSATPEGLNRSAGRAGEAPGRYVHYHPPVFNRPYPG